MSFDQMIFGQMIIAIVLLVVFLILGFILGFIWSYLRENRKMNDGAAPIDELENEEARIQPIRADQRNTILTPVERARFFPEDE